MKLVFLTFTIFLGVCMIQAEGTVPTVNSGTSHDAKSNSELPSAHPEPPSKSDQAKSEKAKEPESTPVTPVPAKSEKAKEPESTPAAPVPAKSEKPKETEASKEKAVPTEKLKEPESDPVKPISSTTTEAPSPSHGSWNVTEHNVTCILVEGFITLNARNATDNKVIQAIPILPNTIVEGSCTGRYIQWNITEGALGSSLRFTFNATKDEYFLSRVDGQVYFPKILNAIGFMNATPQFKTPKNKSYFCGKSIVIDLEKKKGIDFEVELKDFKIEAEKTSKTHGFDEGIDGCPAPHHGTPDIIPIIVGCALAILVVVVLVAYLINRRRSQAHGYLSM